MAVAWSFFFGSAQAKENLFETAPTKFVLSVSHQENASFQTSQPCLLPGGSLYEEKEDLSYEEYQADWASWLSTFSSRWYRNLRKTQDQFGLQFQTQRAALIRFTCYADGHIDNVSLTQSSGITAYDKLQIAALVHSQPLPLFPRNTQRASVTFTQGWESHCKRPGEEEFHPWNFAAKYPKEKTSRARTM
ncbi:MAG: TonB C-terminal domain-containing protein [Candidatus Obscuribacterales bacterium]|nr:TonB C-terminal domain-containing protein [Candidatus Obscuribacterales bacterium]